MRTILVLLVCVVAAGAADAADRPNVVLILADDFGRELLPCYGGTSYELPQLDRLAADGCVFETCYATPLCSPSRVELITAQYSFRNYTAWGERDPDSPTFVQRLRDAGYCTVMAGKWHMGGWDQSPPGVVRAGFDSYCSFDYVQELAGSFEFEGNRYWGGPVVENGEKSRLDRYGPDVQCDFITDAIADAGKSEEPLFAYLALDLCHRPFMPTADHPDAPAPGEPIPHDWLGAVGSAEHFPAMVGYVDKVVGRIREAIDAAGLAENTIVVFTADNGTDNVHEAKTVRSQYRDRAMPGGKYFPTELGLNVPLLAAGPGVQSGSRTEALIDFTDIGATLIAIAGAESLPQSDGVDLRPVWSGEAVASKPYVWSFGNYERSSRKYKDPRKHQEKLFDVIRGPRHKWVGRGQLYDLDRDWFEESPLKPADSRTIRGKLKSQNETIRTSQPRAW